MKPRDRAASGYLVSRRQPRGQETREHILAVALSEFAHRGYPAVSIEEIAADAGVTKEAVYYWFADKDDVGRDLLQQMYSASPAKG
jgi:AcrR family transcriptional regulator